MPRPTWKHICSTGSSGWIGTSLCRTCQQPGTYDGWKPTMHEAMAQYQTLHRLKPVGPHRRMADALFASVRRICLACTGRGLQDSADRRGWQVCTACRGLGSVLTRPAEEIEALRGRVLAAHPGAAANPVAGLFAGPVVFALATQEAIGPDPGAPSRPVFEGIPDDGAGTRDVLALVPLAEDVRHLEAVVRLTASSSPLEQVLLWRPTDPADQRLRRFLLDFGHRVLAAAGGLTALPPAPRTGRAR
jgi:hypothetical protein